MKNLEIKPMQGFGDIPFGALTAEVNAILGEPLGMENVPTDDVIETLVLEYKDGISVFLEGETEPIVSNFDIMNPKATLYGKEVFKMSPDEVVALMNAHGFSTIDKEEEEWGELRISVEEALVDFYFEDKRLASVNFAVMTNEKGEIVQEG